MRDLPVSHVASSTALCTWGFDGAAADRERRVTLILILRAIWAIPGATRSSRRMTPPGAEGDDISSGGIRWHCSRMHSPQGSLRSLKQRPFAVTEVGAVRLAGFHTPMIPEIVHPRQSY